MSIFSGAILSLMTKMHLYPRCAATIARPTPVLPLVGSMIVEPGFKRPSRSAASIIVSAGRSLELPPGLVVSNLAIRSQRSPPLILPRRTMGVLPMS